MFFLSRYGIIYWVIVHSETSHFSPNHNLSKYIFTAVISNPGVQLIKKSELVNGVMEAAEWKIEGDWSRALRATPLSLARPDTSPPP